MNPDASAHDESPDEREGGIVGAAVVAILFAALAAISFAVDHSLTLPNAPAPPAYIQTR